LDERYPDTKVRFPVKQKSGAFKDYFVSTTARINRKGSPSIFEQSHYLDASAVAFYALSYGLQSKGVGEDNFGLALRHDTYRSASFSIMLGEGHDKDSGDAAYALGECSYKVFLDIGGTPKTRAQKYP